MSLTVPLTLLVVSQTSTALMFVDRLLAAIIVLLMQEALGPLNGNYTAVALPFKGTVALPSASGSAPVEMSLAQTAAQAWATEVALLHASGMTAEAQAANRYISSPSGAWPVIYRSPSCSILLPIYQASLQHDCSWSRILRLKGSASTLSSRGMGWPRDVVYLFRQQAGGQRKPVVLEGKLQSPKLLAVAHGSNAPETTAAVSALGSAIQRLQQQLSSVFEDR